MSNDKEKITSLLGDGEGQKMSKKKKMILGGVCIAVIAAFSWWMGSKETGPRLSQPSRNQRAVRPWRKQGR